MKRGKKESTCCLKQEYIRFEVVKFTNKTYGVIDNHHGNFLSLEGEELISRDDFKNILKLGQGSIGQARKKAFNLNKLVKQTQWSTNE